MTPASLRRTLLSTIAVLGITGAGGLAWGESPVGRSAAASEAVVRAGTRVGEPEPARVKFGHAELYVPPFFHPVNGKYDLVVHFHGIASLQENNFDEVRLN
ncbi:MAG TPA: hypothetical protein VIF09_15070, partial [Polyangiaceae bacterium]